MLSKESLQGNRAYHSHLTRRLSMAAEHIA